MGCEVAVALPAGGAVVCVAVGWGLVVFVAVGWGLVVLVAVGWGLAVFVAVGGGLVAVADGACVEDGGTSVDDVPFSPLGTVSVAPLPACCISVDFCTSNGGLISLDGISTMRPLHAARKSDSPRTANWIPNHRKN